MDDVDRLFECFKCGISPPESAFKERKTRGSTLKRKSLRSKGSSLTGLQSPLSGGQCEQNVSDSKPRLEKVGSVTDRAEKDDSKKQISPVVFYGSPHGVPPKRPSSLLRLLREIRIDLAEKHRSNLRKEVWATFPKQDEAMKFSREHPNVHVFSYQDHFNGQRRFLVSSYNVFWQRYKNMDSKFRHHYEVIQEGLPCHLYFDLEFEKAENGDKNGDQMVDLLISVVFEALHEKYCIQGDLDWIVELDSSNNVKFSRHLLIRIPKAAFKDNSHAGVFINEICSRIGKLREKDDRFEQLFVSKGSSASGLSSQLFVDTAVYSRNRCFRLALSSKAGKTSVLLPTGRFKCKEMCEEDVFFASLICNMDNDCEKLLICKTDIDCVKTLHYDTEVNHENMKQPSSLQQYRFDACPSDASKTYFMGKSPFPALDAFIVSVASIGNVSGKIRCWYWFSEYNLMVYSMLRNRFCERIGREHKSNHVMYVVDLQWALYYQKCYDPDCRGYRSPSRPIPLEIIPETFGSGQSETNQNHATNDSSVETVAESPCSESWWLEAVKIADTVENTTNLLEVENYALSEDEEWWTEVERTASESEVSHLSLNNTEAKIQS